MSTYTLPIVKDSKIVNTTGTIYGKNEPEDLTCVCGTTMLEGGFMFTNAQGTPSYLKTILPVPAGTVVYEDLTHMVCCSCGALYSEKEIDDTSVARIIVQFDTQTPEFRNAVEIYLVANAF